MKVYSIVALACLTSATKLKWFDPILFQTDNTPNTDQAPSKEDEAKIQEENKK